MNACMELVGFSTSNKVKNHGVLQVMPRDAYLDGLNHEEHQEDQDIFLPQVEAFVSVQLRYCPGEDRRRKHVWVRRHHSSSVFFV